MRSYFLNFTTRFYVAFFFLQLVFFLLKWSISQSFSEKNKYYAFSLPTKISRPGYTKSMMG